MKKSKKRNVGKAPRTKADRTDDFFAGSGRNVPYEPSDSEDEYSQQEKMLLEKVRSNASKSKSQKKVAVMDLPSSGEDDDDDDTFTNRRSGAVGEEDSDEDVNMDSDIEGKDDDDLNLPDQRAWGKTRRNYYNTDYVDQDYGGFDGEDAEAAELEEQEAREIQRRLAAELDDNDFTLDVFTKTKEDDQLESKISEEIIKTDLSQLSSRQKLALLQKEAPELIGIISEFRDIMEELQHRLQPAIGLVQRNQVSSAQLVRFIQTKYHLVNNYTMNMGFYLLLRARRLPVAAHPVVKRLLQYRQLLQQLAPLETVATKQLDELLSASKNGTLPILQENGLGPKKETNKQLRLLSLTKTMKKVQDAETIDDFDSDSDEISKNKEKSKSEIKSSKSSKLIINEPKAKTDKLPWENNFDVDDENIGFDNEDGDGGDEEMDESGVPDNSELQEEGDSKRAITWQMAKNKGLTPHRKKEQRNPRVKHRNKFRKAKIRRKGQVREPRTETKRYGGEMSGIKKALTKSVKIK